MSLLGQEEFVQFFSSFLPFLFLGAFGKIYYFLIFYFSCSCFISLLFNVSSSSLLSPPDSSVHTLFEFSDFPGPPSSHIRQNVHGPWHREVSTKEKHL